MEVHFDQPLHRVQTWKAVRGIEGLAGKANAEHGRYDSFACVSPEYRCPDLFLRFGTYLKIYQMSDAMTRQTNGLEQFSVAKEDNVWE